MEQRASRVEDVVTSERAAGFWVGRRVLLTGATGFLGSHVAHRLVDLGAEVFATVRAETPRPRIADLNGRVQLIDADLRDVASIRAAVARAEPTVVYHLAAFGVNRPFDNAARAVEVNVLGTAHLLESTGDRELERFVYVGTCYEHADGTTPVTPDAPLHPANVYAATKSGGALLCEAYRRTHGLRLTTVRPFQTYGPWQAPDLLIPFVILSILGGRPVQITSGEQIRDYLFISDLVDALVAAGERQAALGATVTVGSGRGIRVRAVVEAVARMLGAEDMIKIGDLPQRAGEVWDLHADTSTARRLLDWTPAVELSDGLARTIDWYRTHGAAMEHAERTA